MFLLCGWLSGLGCLSHRSPFQHSPPLAPPWIFHLQGPDGGFLVFPEAHFPFGICGVSLLGPCSETETMGAFPSYTLPPWSDTGPARWGRLEPTAREVPVHFGEQSQRTSWRKRKRKSGWHLSSPEGFRLPCSPVVMAHSPTSHAAKTPPLWGVPNVLRLVVRTDAGTGWSSSHPKSCSHPGGRPPSHPLI